MAFRSSPQASVFVDVDQLPRTEDLQPFSHTPDFLVTRSRDMHSYAILLKREEDEISAEKEVRITGGGPIPHAIPLETMQITVRDLVRFRIIGAGELEELSKLSDLRQRAEAKSEMKVVITPQEERILEKFNTLLQNVQDAIMERVS